MRRKSRTRRTPSSADAQEGLQVGSRCSSLVRRAAGAQKKISSIVELNSITRPQNSGRSFPKNRGTVETDVAPPSTQDGFPRNAARRGNALRPHTDTPAPHKRDTRSRARKSDRSPRRSRKRSVETYPRRSYESSARYEKLAQRLRGATTSFVVDVTGGSGALDWRIKLIAKILSLHVIRDAISFGQNPCFI
jgi:hypothetical protein